MIASAPAWAVWLALSLGLAAVLVWAVVLLMLRRVWRQLAPTIMPTLQALGFLASGSAGTDAVGSSPAVPLDPDDDGDDIYYDSGARTRGTLFE